MFAGPLFDHATHDGDGWREGKGVVGGVGG
jgi:hypothetical protein